MDKEETEPITVERFVPQGRTSLDEDAPGWGTRGASNDDNDSDPRRREGPICWKCRGSGQKRQKIAQGKKQNNLPCTVCQGNGRLLPKSSETAALSRPGVIRKARTPPKGWEPALPLAYGLLKESKWRDMVICADDGKDVVMADQQDSDANENDGATTARPDWLPRQGEEFCKLNGAWRILQRVGGHRWTTDDCVTAYIAVREAMQQFPRDNQTLRYLDLGTGNGSVLQMVLRALLQENFGVTATGIEARKEAVGLARRSLLFNVGPDFPAEVIHGDFRDVLMDPDSDIRKCDLVTGTPPYFRVDFNVVQGGVKVKSAVIRQGGMPTARQSAPARCEFRGGIEAYCEAASRAIKLETGRFIVCENFENHGRVLQAAEGASLQILHIVQVQGRQARKPLFCVYVMKKPNSVNITTSAVEATKEVLAVRDDDGNWTKAYAENVFARMSIPRFVPSANRS
eukprot:scaffold2192_cov170-Amphora_coffeaeformis.AAC.15